MNKIEYAGGVSETQLIRMAGVSVAFIIYHVWIVFSFVDWWWSLGRIMPQCRLIFEPFKIIFFIDEKVHISSANISGISWSYIWTTCSAVELLPSQSRRCYSGEKTSNSGLLLIFKMSLIIILYNFQFFHCCVHTFLAKFENYSR